MKHGDARAALAAEIERARRALRAERAAPLLLTPVLAALVWLAASLFGGHDLVPPLAASLTTLAALAAIVALAIQARANYRSPTTVEARARLEADAKLDRGALEPLDDQPAKLDPVALALWRRAQSDAEALARRVAAAPARPVLHRADPFRLRYAVPIAVAAGLIVAGPQAGDRLARAFVPDPGPLVGDGPLQIEGWASPAPYTGAGPAPLSDRVGQTISTPPNVEVTLRITGPVGAPILVFTPDRTAADLAPVPQKVTFQRAADGAWEARMALPRAGSLKVVRYLTKARWRIEPAPDAPPSIRFTAEPQIRDGKVVFSWAARDDFGVRAAWLAVSPVTPPEGLASAAPARTVLDSPAAEPRDVEADVDLDLVAHPYAGMEVEARVVVADAQGQEAQSAPVRVKLPEKIFLQPLAQAAIEIRKVVLHEKRAYAPMPTQRERGLPATMLVPDPLLGFQELSIATDDQAPRLERAPNGIHHAVAMLDGLTIAPQDGFFADAAVFLGLKAARSSLANAADIDETRTSADMLWETAMRAEYGDSADAKKALDMAQKALSEAMANGASQDEIDRLTQAYRKAMQKYVEALTQEAIRNGRTAETREDAQQQSSLSQTDIQRMLDDVRRLNAEGRTAEAQQLLQQLSQLLQNLEVRLASGPGQGGSSGNRELDQKLENLSDAIGKQRALRDDTQRAENNTQNGGKPDPSANSPGELAQRQDALRKEFEKAREGAQGKGGAGDGDGRDEADEKLGQAGKSMREAEAALRRGDVGKARAAQDEALRAMRQGADALSKSAAKQDGRSGQSADDGQGARDPLGRRTGAGVDGGDDIGLPDAMQRERAREILDELRRRAQDPRRPEAEREYLRRLLDRFTGS
jgi:hypothetical protein